jgi:hypothetical protein
MAGVDVPGKVVPLAYDVPGPNRGDGVERGRRFSTWINPLDPSPNPHHPECFGHLVFVNLTRISHQVSSRGA